MDKKLELIIADFDDILNMILPPIAFDENIDIRVDKFALESHGISFEEDRVEGQYAEVTVSKGEYVQTYYEGDFSGFGAAHEKDGKTKIHLGVDFSYGKEKMISCSHPSVYSPITGVIENLDEKNGEIIIKDLGHIKIIGNVEVTVYYYHIVQNLDEINPYLKIGTEVYAGKSQLGNMGGRSINGRYWYPQHVHYGIKMMGKGFTGSYEYELTEKLATKSRSYNEKWFYLDPKEFWDNGLEFGIEEFDEIIEEEKETENEENSDSKVENQNNRNENGEIVLKR